METLEERRAAAKRKLAAAKERAAEKQYGGETGRTLPREAPLGLKKEEEKPLSPKEKAKMLAEQAAAEKAARLAAQRQVREEASIASRRETHRASLENAHNGASWLNDEQRQEHIKEKLATAASCATTKRLKEAVYGGGGGEGVSRPSANALTGSAEPALAAVFEYLEQKWQSPEITGALLTYERTLHLQIGKLMDEVVRKIGYGSIERHYQEPRECLENIHNFLGQPLAELLEIAVPVYEVHSESVVFSLKFSAWDSCLQDFLDDFYSISLPLEGGFISTMVFRYLQIFFAQLALKAVELRAESVLLTGRCGSFPLPLADLFYENMTTYYLSKNVAPALFELQPLRAFATREATFMRQRGFGQH